MSLFIPTYFSPISQYAAIVKSDEIIFEMEVGVEAQNFKKTMSITNRKQAIKTACQLAEPNDIILVAGKGHETYQDINGVKSEFNDYKITENFLKQLNK